MRITGWTPYSEMSANAQRPGGRFGTWPASSICAMMSSKMITNALLLSSFLITLYLLNQTKEVE